MFDLAWTDMNVTAPEQVSMEKIALYVCILFILSHSDCIFALYSLTECCQNRLNKKMDLTLYCMNFDGTC